MEHYALMIRANEKLEKLDFSPILGGDGQTEFTYDCWRKSMEISNDPVTLWQVVNARFTADTTILGLVDEEGLMHSPPDPINYKASWLFSDFGVLHGDVVVVKASQIDGQIDLLTAAECDAICALFGEMARTILVE